MIRLFLIMAAALLAQSSATAPDHRASERIAMVNAVENLAESAPVAGARRLDGRVLAALRRVPRHLFVPDALSRRAYENRPLPIGHEATISQPYIVALMSHLLQVKPGHRVLEIGTGSGYQAAVLAELGGQVRTIEIVEPLAREAEARLRRLGYGGIMVRAGDGYAGWPDAAPFDRIIVTAGAPHIPQPLIDQLKPGGRMVIPVTRRRGLEDLMLVTKGANGKVRRRAITEVTFVPLTRAAE